METISNEKLTLITSNHGAELQSIKDADGREYLWQADPRFWGRHSPILFPLVCGLWKDTYRIDGQEYHLTRHGFARDTDFKVLTQSKSRIVYGLHDTPETLAKYPYHFNLGIGYKLDGNRIHVVWHVENTDERTIYFQIGGHPAFRIPGLRPGEPMHGCLRLDTDNPIRLFGNVGGCIVKGKHAVVETEDKILSFNEETFKDDALIFDHCQLHEAALLGPDNEPVVTVRFKSPALGIWSPYGKNAPFVCIEPWYGLHDYVDYEGEYRDKYLMNQLLPGCSFMSEYTIEINV